MFAIWVKHFGSNKPDAYELLRVANLDSANDIAKKLMKERVRITNPRYGKARGQTPNIRIARYDLVQVKEIVES